jgi:deazaflavin-dependent oxidoreductase (nitroreductase family)
VSDWNDQVIAQFRAGNERIADMFDRSALVVLTTTGAKSGQPRISPLVHFADGDDLLIVASAAGADTHPAWYFNLLANPKASVELWQDGAIASFEVTAAPVAGEERDRLYAGIVAQAPGFGEYQEKTSRVIPVVRLTRA